MNWRLSLAGKYRLEPEAKQDLKESVLWYEKQQEGVGERFFQNVFEKIEQISERPDSNPKFHNNYRKASIKKFPFYIFYTNEKTFVSIVAIWHKSRNPESFKERVDKNQ
ncbi:MAG TPA: type II toxin-antitoxin system RelE/ParE family toxin [Leptospiraceae bacterium]|nr:type II toxin-antitoxin system RelE/ParE family toxin [Leptospiraceae bacterium]